MFLKIMKYRWDSDYFFPLFLIILFLLLFVYILVCNINSIVTLNSFQIVETQLFS